MASPAPSLTDGRTIRDRRTPELYRAIVAERCSTNSNVRWGLCGGARTILKQHRPGRTESLGAPWSFPLRPETAIQEMIEELHFAFGRRRRSPKKSRHCV
jgi:hypothetical protein